MLREETAGAKRDDKPSLMFWLNYLACIVLSWPGLSNLSAGLNISVLSQSCKKTREKIVEQTNIQPHYRVHNTGRCPNSTVIIRKLNVWLKCSEMLETYEQLV